MAKMKKELKEKLANFQLMQTKKMARSKDKTMYNKEKLTQSKKFLQKSIKKPKQVQHQAPKF